MNIHKRISDLIIENKYPFALCTVIETKGSAPRHSAKMIVFENKNIEFTIGGGPAEFKIIQEAAALISLGESKTLKLILNQDADGGLPMTCGGTMTIHIEVYKPRPQLILIGAGHVNREVLRTAKPLGYQVLIIDDRPAEYTEDLADVADAIYAAATMKEAIELARPAFNTASFYVIATKDGDEAALEALGEVDAEYVGLIGSKRKVKLIREHLRERGMDSEFLNRVEMPVGLDLGGESPAEIALSVMAQIQTKRYKTTGKPMKEPLVPSNLVVIRGAGDLATGIACRLYNAGHKVICTEIAKPTAIRHSVSFAKAAFEGEVEVEGIKAEFCKEIKEVSQCLELGMIPVYNGCEATLLSYFKPQAFIEATIRKAAHDMSLDLAPLVIGVGPGFLAPENVHCVIETMRGHFLGRVIWDGAAIANTGIPGEVGGFTIERVIKAPCAGLFKSVKHIGDYVTKGQVIANIHQSDEQVEEVRATIEGVLRGILWDDILVTPGFKIADIDPRADKSHCFTISDKARAIGGGVLEALEHYLNNNIK